MQASNTADNHPILRAENLGYQVNNQHILTNLSFQIKSGERLAIIGASGSGKSTLLRLLNRLIEPTSGTVFINESDYHLIPPRTLRRQLGLVLQTPYLFPGTVASNLRFGPGQKGEHVPDEVIEDLLDRVDLPGYAQRDVSNLSGGEAQRVSVARALANSPEILLLDEPTSALDDESRIQVEDLLCHIADRQNLTCIIVTHDQEQARKMSDTTMILEKGAIKKMGPTKEMINAH